jgi:hypothetical protein
MKKGISLTLAAALFVIFAVCSFGANVQNADTAAINFVILPWVQIDFADASFDLEVAQGGSTASDTVDYTANGNIDGTVTVAITTMPNNGSVDAPGTWSASVDISSLVAGVTTNGTATVQVSDLTGNEDYDSYSGGVATITITSIEF